MIRTIIAFGSGSVDFSTMDASSTKGSSPCTKRINKKNLPNVDKVMMVVSDSAKQPRRERRNFRASSLSHVLFPSRCPPPISKKASGDEKSGYASLALTIESFAATKIAPIGTTAASNGSPKRFIRQTLHRRNKHLFASSHSPTKSSSSTSSSSPSKVRGSKKVAHIRKRHRRHNLALNASDFEVLFRTGQPSEA